MKKMQWIALLLATVATVAAIAGGRREDNQSITLRRDTVWDAGETREIKETIGADLRMESESPRNGNP